ncbi:unnamed protein product [Ilex paraguariensis]
MALEDNDEIGTGGDHVENEDAWTPSVENKAKFSRDGAYKHNNPTMSVGIIVRNSRGHLIEGRGMTFSVVSSLLSKAIALCEACLLAISMQSKEAMMKSNNKELVQLSAMEIVSGFSF